MSRFVRDNWMSMVRLVVLLGVQTIVGVHYIESIRVELADVRGDLKALAVKVGDMDKRLERFENREWSSRP